MKRGNKVERLINALTIVVVSLLCITCDTERNIDPQVSFIKYYGGNGNQEAVDVHVNSDGTIIILGTTSTNGTSNIYLVRTDYNGNILNTATYGVGTDVAKDLEPTFDGNFVVLVKTRIQNIDSVKLLKITPDLIKIDSVMDGFQGKDASPNTVTAVQQFGFNDFIVTGTTKQIENQSNSLSSFMQLRFREDLSPYSGLNWPRILDNGIKQSAPITQVGIRSVELADNSLYVLGYSNSPTDETNFIYNIFYFPIVVYLDPDTGILGGSVSGDKVDYAIKSLNTDFLKEVSSPSSDAVGAFSTSSSGGIQNIVFSRFPIFTKIQNLGVEYKYLGNPINTNLNISGAFAQKNLEAVKILSKNSDTGYYIVANEVELDDSRNIWVSRIDGGGSVLWSSSFGAKENDDRAAAVAELPDGRVIVLGTMRLENQDKLALINLNRSGKLRN